MVEIDVFRIVCTCFDIANTALPALIAFRLPVIDRNVPEIRDSPSCARALCYIEVDHGRPQFDCCGKSFEPAARLASLSLLIEGVCYCTSEAQ